MQKKKYYLNIIFMLVLLGLVFYTILKEAGFTHYTVFQKRKPVFYKIMPPPATQFPS